MYKEKIELGKITLKNRIVMAPMSLGLSDNGTVGDKLLDYYDKRTKSGGFGLVITEHSYIREDGIASANQLSCSKDSDIEGLSKLADTIHKNGSKVLLQISHGGSSIKTKHVSIEGISPSGIINPNGILGSGDYQKSHEMTIDEINDIKKCYIDAAIRAKESGFDGVEINSAHGYLLNQFYSTLTNKRTDEYNGNTMTGRLKIHLEIIKEFKKIFNDDFIIGIRLGGCDYLKDGSTLEDAAVASKMLEEAGVDFIDVSGGMCFFTRDDNNKPGYFKDQSIRIKEKVKIPVILTGGIKTLNDVEKLLEEQSADLIGIGRAISQNENWLIDNGYID